MHETGFVEDLALVLGVAAVTGFLFSRWKQPNILGYLLAGLIVGPYIPIPLFADPARVEALSEFGVVLVMFTVGLEFRLAKFLAVLPVCGATGLVEVGALLTGGYFLGLSLGFGDLQSLFLGACLCISSTMAVSKILQQRPLPAASKSLVYGVLVLQDVAAIALIAVMTAISGGSQASFSEALAILGKLSAVLVAMVAVGMFFVPRFMRVLDRTQNKEVLVVGGVGLCFSFALAAEGFGYSPALGAFIGGILVAESGLGHQVESVTSSVRDVFVAVFFVSIGMSVDPVVAWEMLPTSLAVLAAVVGLQFIAVTLAGTASGNGLKTSLSAGLALGQIGEFAFIIGAIGVASGILDQRFNSILVTVAMLSTFTTSLALQFRERIVQAVEGLIPGRIIRFLDVYEAWWLQLRKPIDDSGQSVRGVVTALVLDLAMMAAIILSWQAWEGEIGTVLTGTFGFGVELSHVVSVAALGLSLLPALVTLFLTSRILSQRLADRLFREQQTNARAVFAAALGLLVVVAIGIPSTLFLGRAVGVAYVWPAFALALALAMALAWRRLGTLDAGIHSGGMIMLRTIAGQGFADAEGASLSWLPQNVTAITLTTDSFAIGKTLAELQLRGSTGASVIALGRAQGETTLPTGTETLEGGMTLYLAGSEGAQEAAQGLLSSGSKPYAED